MSLIDLASLVLAPTATKEGKVYSAIPDTGDGDMTFTRGSAATRINSAGLIEKERGNLLLQSNTFDTTWSLENLSVTSGQSGYDGSSDAWKVTPSIDDTYHRLTNSVSGASNMVTTLSVYAKADGYNFIRVSENGTTGDYATFNLSNGSVANNTSLDAKIESIGNGWYRCSSTIIPATTHRFDMYVMETATIQQPWDGDGVSGILIQDAMLNQGLVAQSYIPTTTSAVYEGITDDVPRVDYSGGGCPSLLLESQRSNLYTNSEYYDGYTQANLTISTNATTSPEGLQNASKLVSSSGTSIKRIQPSITTSSATDYIISAFVKKAEWDYFFIYGDGTLSSGQNAIWDLENGTITQGSGHSTIESFGQGWYKITWKATASGAGSAAPRIGITDNSSGVNSNGDGTSGVFLYGLQIEEGSYSTSYIPTYSVSSTRVADSCSKTGISELIGQTEGTLFVEASTLINGADCRITLSDGTINNRVSIEWDVDADTIKGFIGVGGNVQTTSYNQTNTNKIAILYTTSVAKLFVNGNLVDTDAASIPTMSGIGQIEFSNYGGLLPFVGNVKQLLYFPTALTDAECIELTTI